MIELSLSSYSREKRDEGKPNNLSNGLFLQRWPNKESFYSEELIHGFWVRFYLLTVESD